MFAVGTMRSCVSACVVCACVGACRDLPAPSLSSLRLVCPAFKHVHVKTQNQIKFKSKFKPTTKTQVEYVLSDKTGTLTQNVMGFVLASIGGRLYGHTPATAAAEAAAAADAGGGGAAGGAGEALLGGGAGAPWMAPQGSVAGVPNNTPHTVALDRRLRAAVEAAAARRRRLGPRRSGFSAAAGAPAAAAPTSATADDAAGERALDFLLALALCNTVVPTATESGQLLYQAASPDEEALVAAAAYLGVKLVARAAGAAEVEVAGELQVTGLKAIEGLPRRGARGREAGAEQGSCHALRSSTAFCRRALACKPPTQPRPCINQPSYKIMKQRYELLSVLEFSSDRKRMSVAVRGPVGAGGGHGGYGGGSGAYGGSGAAAAGGGGGEDEESVLLLCKGADNVVFERLEGARALKGEGGGREGGEGGRGRRRRTPVTPLTLSHPPSTHPLHVEINTPNQPPPHTHNAPNEHNRRPAAARADGRPPRGDERRRLPHARRRGAAPRAR